MTTLALRALPQRTACQILISISIVLLDHNHSERVGQGHGKQAATVVELFLPIAVPQETVIANASESVGKYMEQKAPDEFLGGQRHRFHGAASSIVFPLETHLVVLDSKQAMVGDGHTVGISAHIVEDLLGAGEWSLGIDYPLPLFQVRAMLGEGGGVSKGVQAPRKT